MLLAGLFAGALFLGMILGDWLYFVRLTPDAVRYGCGIARMADRFTLQNVTRLEARVDADGALTLPHGIARYYPDLRQIALRPQYHLFAMGFRTAWPLKGLIQLTPDGQTVHALCVKRIPWSSAIMTLIWFVLVGAGTTAFMIAYGAQGGFDTLTGLLMGAGILGIGLLVFTFGVVTVIFSYRLENSRFSQVYDELKAAVDETGGSSGGL
jgi:uncharacterized membrane-anchored protein YitT (DUF2179 family)